MYKGNWTFALGSGAAGTARTPAPLTGSYDVGLTMMIGTADGNGQANSAALTISTACCGRPQRKTDGEPCLAKRSIPPARLR